jgi:hypothetical protein
MRSTFVSRIEENFKSKLQHDLTHGCQNNVVQGRKMHMQQKIVIQQSRKEKTNNT